jgi:hypothetical protein
MNNLESRIEALENKIFVDVEEQPEGVFIRRVNARKDAPPPEPVKGWKYHEHEIMRMENETDEALNKRAIAQVKPFMAKDAAPVFFSIDHETLPAITQGPDVALTSN